MSDPKGWISIHRQIKNHWVWEGEKFTRGQAWVDLLLNANHSPKKFMIKDTLISLQRGQQARSMVTLASEWKWSRDKVKRFLVLLQKDGMIECQTSQLTSIISICNYSGFQDSETADKSAEQQQTGSGQVTNNNDNNENKKTPRKKYIFSDDDKTCANYMWSLLKELDPEHAIPNLEAWANDVRLMVERDKRTHKEICVVFKWCNLDSFEQSNVQCPSKLRKRFDQLKLKVKNNDSQTHQGHQNQPRSAIDRAQDNINKARFENSEPVGSDVGDFREQVGGQFRDGSGPSESVGSHIEGHFTRTDENGTEETDQ